MAIQERPEGVEAPRIWGKPATWSNDDPIIDVFSHWLCPHCGAHLTESAPGRFICLNACHLTAPQYVAFHRGLREAASRTRGEEGP